MINYIRNVGILLYLPAIIKSNFFKVQSSMNEINIFLCITHVYMNINICTQIHLCYTSYYSPSLSQ